MFLESFRHLIEIEALKRENQQNFQHIASENKRISDLEERRKKTISLSENLKIEEKNLKLQENQNQIEDLQLRLNKLTSQLSIAANATEQMAFEKQITTTKTEIEQLEQLYFEKLEKSEEITAQIKDNAEFIAGSVSTLEEIKKEVQANVDQEKTIIENRNKRINSLTELCHPSVKSLYLELEKKFAPKSPVSFMIDKKCSGCHVQLDSVLKSSLEEGRSVECCPNCSKLLIPDSARLY